MSQSILIQISLDFSAKIIKLQQYLTKQKKESIISKQIIRSATSIGANINEANYGSSKADFISKMHIALKECAETEYWLRLLKESEYITNEIFNPLINDCLSIKKMLIATLNTAKKNNCK
jgi:four helix bundle protein